MQIYLRIFLLFGYISLYLWPNINNRANYKENITTNPR